MDRPSTPAAEASLIAKAVGGDRDALDQLLRQHQARVYAICLRLMTNESDARDATQESLIAICRGITRFDARSAFTTWIYRVTTNACLDELRRRNRRPEPVDTQHDGDHLMASTPESPVADRLTLNEALARLPIEFRAPVVLRDLCELDYREIAEVLSIPPGTVRSRIARGRTALLRDIGNQPASDERPTPRP